MTSGPPERQDKKAENGRGHPVDPPRQTRVPPTKPGLKNVTGTCFRERVAGCDVTVEPEGSLGIVGSESVESAPISPQTWGALSTLEDSGLHSDMRRFPESHNIDGKKI